MKKRYLYFILFAVFISAVGFVVLKYRHRSENKFYSIRERKGLSARLQEWPSVRNRAGILVEKIKSDPADNKSKLALAALFIQEARITGDLSYYDVAAMKYVNDVLKTEPTNFEAMLYKSIIFLSQHHFADGLATATQAQKLNPYNAFVYGILVDGNVESGFYDSAVANSDRMVSIRPDLRSYSRISYLREIYGDYPGAIEAMKMAVDAGVPGDEATEWARVQLGHLYEKTGDRQRAAMHYTISMDERPGYAYALAGMARLAGDQGDLVKAANYYMQADSMVNDVSFREELSGIYKLKGDKAKAEKINETIIEQLSTDSKAATNDASIGHYSDRELAYAYLRSGDNNKALEHATMEYNRRPKNIDVNETMAWVYYSMKDYQKALPFMDAALSTHCSNPLLLCHAGLIYYKAGNKERAAEYLNKALKNDPVLPLDIKEESRQAIVQLNNQLIE